MDAVRNRDVEAPEYGAVIDGLSWMPLQSVLIGTAPPSMARGDSPPERLNTRNRCSCPLWRRSLE